MSASDDRFRFIPFRQRDIVEMCLRDGKLEDEAHTLKSCAGTFGARRLQVLARDVESACREERHEDAVALARRIDNVLAETLAAYRLEFADLADDND